MWGRRSPWPRRIATAGALSTFAVSWRAGGQEAGAEKTPPVEPRDEPPAHHEAPPSPGPPGPPASPGSPGKDAGELPVADAVFTAIVHQEVAISMRWGSVIHAFVLATERETLIVALFPRGDVRTIAKRDIFDIRVIERSLRLGAADPFDIGPERLRPTSPHPPPKPATPNTRSLGIQVGASPSAMIDLDYRWFYGFTNLSLVLPFVAAAAVSGGTPFGGVSTTHLWDFTLGAGGTTRLGRTTRWQADFMLLGGGSNWRPSDFTAAAYPFVGGALGFHVTTEAGFTFAVKLPVIGGAILPSGSQTGALGGFFASAFVGVPLVSFGWRL